MRKFAGDTEVIRAHVGKQVRVTLRDGEQIDGKADGIRSGYLTIVSHGRPIDINVNGIMVITELDPVAVEPSVMDVVTAEPTPGPEAYPGVTKNRHGKWEARAKVDGKRTYLSSYADRRDAIKAVEAATKPEPVQAVGKMPDAEAAGGG